MQRTCMPGFTCTTCTTCTSGGQFGGFGLEADKYDTEATAPNYLNNVSVAWTIHIFALALELYSKFSDALKYHAWPFS